MSSSGRELCIAGIVALLAMMSSLALGKSETLAISCLSAAVFTFWIGSLTFREPFFAACCMPVLFNYFWFVASFLLFEFGAYTPELRMSGAVTGGTARLSFFLYVFIVFARWVFHLFEMPKLDWESNRKRLSDVLPLTLSLLVAVILIYVVYGTAISNSVDRIQYRTNVAPKAYSQIITILVFLSFFLGLVRRKRADLSRNTLLVDLVYVTMLVLLALGGEKFSLLFTSISLYVAPQFYDRKLKIRRIQVFRYFIFAILGVVAVLGLVVNQYMGIVGGGVWDIIGQLLLDRISQQAQLNFYFDKLTFVEHVTHGGVFDFVANEIFGVKASDYRGIQLLMNAASPADLFAIYADAGVTFGDGFPGILFYYFGWTSVFILILCGSVYGLLTSLCLRVSLAGHTITGLILFYIFYNIALSAFLNGELQLLLDVTASKIIAIGVLLAIAAVRLPLDIIRRTRSAAVGK